MGTQAALYARSEKSANEEEGFVMAKTSEWQLRLCWAAGVVALVAGTGFTTSGCSGDGDVASVECDSTREYFASNVWRVVEQKCIACHNRSGLAKDTKYVLKTSAEAGFIDYNLNIIASVASFERDGESLWLLKPSLQIDHKGGLVVEKGSDDYKAMTGLVARLKSDAVCEPNTSGQFTGVEQLDAVGTLRKAAIILAGRMPSKEEVQRVEAGGFAELDHVLDEMMTEPAFLDFLQTTYGDLFETDFYLGFGADVLDGLYANPFWYEAAPHSLMAQYGFMSTDELALNTNVSIAREPLELIKYVASHDKPFTEILTANYMMMTPLSQRTYGGTMLEEFQDPSNALEFQPATLPKYTNAQGDEVAFPHAGVLTSPMMLARHPTTPTNRARHRARMVLLWFLGTDILKAADQPVDQTKITAINPQRDDANCSVCHAVVDTIAGNFQAFQPYDDNDPADDQLGVFFHSEPQWYSEMWPAGLDDKKLPLEAAPYGLQWLGQQVAGDDRFALATVFNLYRGLTGADPLIAPKDYADPLYEAKFHSFLTQSEVFRAVAEHFRAAPYNGSVYNVKVIVKDLVMSPYFRAVNAVPLAEEDLVKLGDVGMGHLLTPEQLHRKIRAVLGIPWGYSDQYGYDGEPLLSPAPRDPTRTGTFQIFYGGVDFVEATARIKDPNGLMAAVAERMAVEMSCYAAPHDMAKPGTERLLFPEVEIGGITYDPRELTPESGGLAVPDAVQGIKQTIAHLHDHILGEKLEATDPEVERTYQLFLETWREGTEKLSVNELDSNLPDRCWAVSDFWTGTPIPQEQQITADEKYTIRSWQAVLTYMLSDYKFLYE
jgi:hypothetical protein